MKNIPRFYYLLLLLWLPGLAVAQSHAGPDKTICVSGTTKLGPETPCTTCCYKWEPVTGLDDPSKPNPVVSGLNTSINYAVTVSFPDGNYETDDVKVTVYDANISIYEPEYFEIETMIPDNEKKIPGAQTFVNLDNDDCDAEFDKDDDMVQGGDNEFIKIKVTMHISQLPAKPGKGAEKGTAMLGPEDKYAAIDLAEGTSVSGVHLWLSNDKAAGEYQIGDQLLLSPVDDDDYEVFLWAEGTEAHIMQQQVKLTARLFEDVNPACAGNFVSITVVGVDMIEWIGVGNGYTNGDGKNNNNTLDNIGSSVRVFPENKSPNDSSPKTKVNLKITFSVVPPVGQSIFLKPFDIDDISTETSFIDPNDLGSSGNYEGSPPGIATLTFTPYEDNRGRAIIEGDSPLSGAKKGKISGGANLIVGSLEIYEYPSVTTKSIQVGFWVSQFCGDNYKVAVSNDPKFLNQTRNLDQYDQQKIVDNCTNPGSSGLCKEIDLSLCSPVITVWRTLHLEYDRMGNPDWTQNRVPKLIFKEFFPSLKNCEVVSFITYSGSIAALNAKPLKDGSLYPGRFENGYPLIGESLLQVCSSCIKEDFWDMFIFNSPQDLTFGGNLQGLIKKAGYGNLIFSVKDISFPSSSNSDAIVSMTPSISTLHHYTGGDLSVAGGEFSVGGKIEVPPGATDYFILKESPGSQSSISIPIEVRDDDKIPFSGKSNIIGSLDVSHAKIVFGEVYIDIADDGGGDITNDNNSLPFTPNLKFDAADGDPYSGPYDGKYYYDTYCESTDVKNSNFWAAYVLSAWQSPTQTDGDPGLSPTGEFSFGAHATDSQVHDCYRAVGGNYLNIYNETIMDLSPNWIKYVLAHELGHIFGLSHGDGACVPPLPINMQVMNGSYGSSGSVTTNSFIPSQINLVRSRANCPGQ